MFTVGSDVESVEHDLADGRLSCPHCGAAVDRWGYARTRRVRGLECELRVRPRRVICSGCGRTHVLLPVNLLLRRADEVTVIGAALLAKAAGAGHRRIAARLDCPASTVRGWLRRMGRIAERVRAALGMVAGELGAEFTVPEPTGTPIGDVVALLGAVAAAATRRLGPCEPWRLASALSGGRLLAPAGPVVMSEWINTTRLWAAAV